MLQKWHASKMKAAVFCELKKSWKNVRLLEKYRVQEEELSVNIPWSILCFVSVSQLVPDFAHHGSTLNPVTTRIIAIFRLRNLDLHPGKLTWNPC